MAGGQALQIVTPLRQIGAIPYRCAPEGVEICLITSRGSGRWITPRGKPEKNKTPQEIAGLEAFEEAGVRGLVDGECFAAYTVTRPSLPPEAGPCAVELYLMEVSEVLGSWPEKKERERVWLPPAQAVMRVEEGGLVDALLRFNALDIGLGLPRVR